MSKRHRRMQFDHEVLKRGHHERYLGSGQRLGITSDGERYACHECGATWRPHRRYRWWPIRLIWSRDRWNRPWFKWHGWQIGYDGIERPVFGRTFHLGPLKIIMGPKRGAQ